MNYTIIFRVSSLIVRNFSNSIEGSFYRMTGIDVHRGQVRLLETDNGGGISPLFLISYQACSFHFIDFHNFQYLDSENIAVSSSSFLRRWAVPRERQIVRETFNSISKMSPNKNDLSLIELVVVFSFHTLCADYI